MGLRKLFRGLSYCSFLGAVMAVVMAVGVIIDKAPGNDFPPVYDFVFSLFFWAASGFVIAFVIAAIVGIPAFLLLSKLNFANKFSLSLVGTMFGFFLEQSEWLFIVTGQQTGMLTASGALGGLVFWIGVSSSKRRPVKVVK